MTSKDRKNNPAAVRIIGNIFIVVVLLLTVELFSFVALRYVIIPKNASLIYTQPYIDPAVYKSHLEYLHPVLGWATPTAERRYSATAESRPNPAFPETESSCVSIYGDSFTKGSEVNDDEAWGNVLSGLLDCKVANFGIDGYGVDQAYLRFRLNDRDKSPINVLGIYPYDILRNLNQYRPFLAGPNASTVALKPRFIIKDDELELIPIPDYSYAEMVEYTKSPSRKFFPHEAFLPGSEYGSPIMGFPHTLVLLRFAASPSMRHFIMRQPSWLDFMKEDHPTEALEITEKITVSFADLAYERDHRPLVLIFPTVSSFKNYKRTGTLTTQPLLDALQRNSIAHIDVHQGISDYLGERDYCEIMTNPESCFGHFNPEGNRIIAILMKQQIESLPK